MKKPPKKKATLPTVRKPHPTPSDEDMLQRFTWTRFCSALHLFNLQGVSILLEKEHAGEARGYYLRRLIQRKCTLLRDAMFKEYGVK